MVSSRINVKLDSPEVRKLLKSQEVGNYLVGIGNKVASIAGPEYQTEVDYASRKTRVVVNVVDPTEGARFKEASTGKLARALGSASA
jgi:hypothetical protein